MSKITQEELELLEYCQSAGDWTYAVNSIKKVRDDEYPSDWWPTVKLSGLMDRILSRWGSDSELKTSSFNTKSEMLKHLGIKDE